MAHPVVFIDLSYSSTTLAEHAVHRPMVPGLWPGWDMFVLVCSVRCALVSHLPTGWPHDHGPTNVRAMVKTIIRDDDELTPSLDRRALELDEEEEDTVDLPRLVRLQLNG